MNQTGGDVALQGRLYQLAWANARPVPRELWAAIRQGATRNLYVANVPEQCAEAEVLTLFKPFGDLESVRLAPRKRVAFINYATITSAIKAKEAMHHKYLGSTDAGSGMAETSGRPLLINFTSAQQNCMRARGERPTSGPWADRGGSSGGMRGARVVGNNDPRGGVGGGVGVVNGTYYTDGRAGMAGDYASEQRGNSRGGRGRDGNGGRGGRGGVGGNGVPSALAGGMPGGNIAAQEKSRALYVGSVPDGVTLEEVAAIFEPFGVIESLRLVRAKSWCAAESLAPITCPFLRP